MKRVRRILILTSATLAILGMLAAAAPTSAAQSAPVIVVRLQPVNGSGVSGFVSLAQIPQQAGGGTFINVGAFGLTPGKQYISLKYETNHTCQLEPYDSGDHIGGTYTANAVGAGTTQGQVDTNLSGINSVSVRKADFTLVACANVHP